MVVRQAYLRTDGPKGNSQQEQTNRRTDRQERQTTDRRMWSIDRPVCLEFMRKVVTPLLEMGPTTNKGPEGSRQAGSRQTGAGTKQKTGRHTDRTG